jgi:hypothetical protein
MAGVAADHRAGLNLLAWVFAQWRLLRVSLVFDAGVAGRKWQQQIPPLRYGMTKKGGRYRMAKSAVGVE